MAMINIPRSKEDPNYRYKMPRMSWKVEGKGNGVKTNVMNLGEISRALKRNPEYVAKYFGCELGAASKFMAAEDKALVNGAFGERELGEVLDRFIATFVLCPQCALPETDLLVRKGAVHYKCNACGDNGPSDNAHRLATFILRNPPGKSTTTVGKPKLSREERQAKRRAAAAAEAEPEGSEPDRAEETKPKEKKSKVKAEDEIVVNESLFMSSPDMTEIVQRFADWVAARPQLEPSAFYQELRNLQIAQGFNATLFAFAAIQALVPGARWGDGKRGDGDDDQGAKADLALWAAQMEVFARVCEGVSAKCDASTICAIERWADLAGVPDDSFPYLLQKAWAADVLDTKGVLAYYQTFPSTKVYRHVNLESELYAADLETSQRLYQHYQPIAKPFTDWLQTESDESD